MPLVCLSLLNGSAKDTKYTFSFHVPDMGSVDRIVVQHNRLYLVSLAVVDVLLYILNNCLFPVSRRTQGSDQNYLLL